jgi:hypothetical protein
MARHSAGSIRPRLTRQRHWLQYFGATQHVMCEARLKALDLKADQKGGQPQRSLQVQLLTLLGYIPSS